MNPDDRAGPDGPPRWVSRTMTPEERAASDAAGAEADRRWMEAHAEPEGSILVAGAPPDERTPEEIAVWEAAKAEADRRFLEQTADDDGWCSAGWGFPTEHPSLRKPESNGTAEPARPRRKRKKPAR